MNQFKTRLKNFELQRGLWITMSDPLAVEMMAGAGYDWMLFDMEHSPIDAVSVLPLMQIAAAFDTATLVRPPSLDVPEIKKLLDLGAQNILIPMVNNAQEAALAVAAVEYPPTGIRGVAGITRATHFGRIADYAQTARESIAILVQVETAEALENIEEIAQTPGIDGVFVGPADLAAALGHVGDMEHPEVQKAVIDTIKRIRACNVAPGFLSADLSMVEQVIDAGAVFVGQDIDIVALKRGLQLPS